MIGSTPPLHISSRSWSAIEKSRVRFATTNLVCDYRCRRASRWREGEGVRGEACVCGSEGIE